MYTELSYKHISNNTHTKGRRQVCGIAVALYTEVDNAWLVFVSQGSGVFLP